MLKRLLRTVAASLSMLTLLVCAQDVKVHAQDRVLGKADILLYGFGLRVEPDHQVVPKDIATIVSSFLASGNPPLGDVPPFAADALVKGVLFGPGYPNGLDLTAKPNTPFNIPPIGVPGIYTFENIRLESGGEILMRGIPESVTIEVIEKLLVTQVTARALSAQEVRDKGIVFDSSNFQAYNFTAAFALQDTPVRITFPVVLPTLQGAQNATVNSVDLAQIPGATLPQLQTIIPDTLRLQTQIPNLQVVGFTLKVPTLQGRQLIVPPIPGVVVIPGDIGFLDQFFSVMLLVGNVAPEGSNLVVSDLRGEILLPPGNDGVVNSGDDPLRMANTGRGESPRIQQVVQSGADGQPGTVDDVATLGPGQSGSAEYLVEGRREGSWNLEFNITGTLNGLPVGPVTVTGRAAGSVVVRNPNFTLTFTHPSTVSAGEKYSLDVTVTNTSLSPANFVSVNLFAQNISGAALVGDPLRSIESIPAGDSATVSFDLVSRVTGKVTAATLDADEQVQGRFALKTAVGELGVPVSPDSLVLPTEASGLPPDLRNAVLGMLGKAWAVATAPSAALPNDVQRFSKQIVYDRAVQAAEAGFRIGLHETVTDSAAQLEMDFIGSDFSRLQTLHPDPADLPFRQSDFTGFDFLRRRSIRGDVLANAVAALLTPELTALGATQFHQSFAEKMAYRPPHLSVVVSGSGAPLPYDVSLIDAQGRRLGGADSAGKVIKEIPYGDFLSFADSPGMTTGQMLLLAAPGAGQYHLRFTPREGVADGPFTVSLVVPDGSGGLRQVVYNGVTGSSSPTSPFTGGETFSVVLDLPIGSGTPSIILPSVDQALVAPVPHLIGVVQQADKDLDQSADEVSDTRAHELGRIIAVLFDQEVTAASVQDRLPRGNITNYGIDGNSVVGVALQPGRRIAFLALRDPVGPFISRQLTVTGVMDGRGRAMAPATLPIETTVTRQAAVVSGQVIDADGTPVPFAVVRLLVTTKGGFMGVSSKSADADGRFSWDWVPSSAVDRIVAVNPATDDQRTIDFTVQRNGQRLNVNVVFLGRGTLTGRTLSETSAPLPNTDVVITSLTDQSQYGARSDDQGRFTMQRIPVGNLLIEAVNIVTHSKGTASEFMPLAGGTVTRDVRLFDVTAPTILVRLGNVTGHVLRGDGAAPVSDVPVVAYYQTGTQTGVNCPRLDQIECAVAAVRTDASGRFVMDDITAGQLRLVSFEQSSFQQGDVRINLPSNGTSDVNILFSQGLGAVTGLVVDADGGPAVGARVGGGLSLTTTDQAGHFTLTDVPVGRTDIVAVSDQLATKGSASVDILQPGQTVNVTVVLVGTASIAGTVFRADGTTPVPNNKVYLYNRTPTGIVVIASVVTDSAGRYRIQSVPLKSSDGADAVYELSSFRSDFSDGNVKLVVPRFNNQVFRGDIVFRGGGGLVNGRVFDSDGVTPLRAAVGISGDQVAVAGGIVGTGFQRVPYYQVVDTDFSTGTFSFSNVFVGPFTLSAAGQFSPDPIRFDSRVASPDATVQVDLRLQATSRVQGTVFLPDGITPVGPNVIVRFSSSGVRVVCASGNGITLGDTTVEPGDCAEIPQGVQNESAVTDANGRFVVPLVNAGSFTLTADDPITGKTGQVLGSVRPGQTGDFSIRLLGVSTLVVRVRGSDATTPIPGARVEVKQVGFPNKSVATLADGQGTVVLNGGDAFAEGDVVVNATDPRTGFAGRAAGKITTDGGTVTLNVYLFDAAGTISGVVHKSDGLTPVPNAEVVITKCNVGPSGGDCVPAGPLAFDVTDANGAYRQENIPLGAFRVEVFEAATARLGFGSGRIDFAGQEVPLDITEAGRGLVTGTALAGGTLAPLTNWEVSLRQITPGGRQIELRAASDIDGTFAFPGVTVGDFRLLAIKYRDRLLPDVPFGAAEVRSHLATEGQRVDVPVIVQLTQTVYGRVEGVVFNANGTPAANVSVALCPGGCQVDLSDPTVELFAVTGADGSFAIDPVPAGRFTLSAKDQTTLNAASGSGQLLFNGDIARLTLTLTGLGRISGTVEFADGRPVQTAQLTLHGLPSSGCDGGSCSAFTDSAGRFTFLDIPARTFWIGATDVVSGLSGTVSGSLSPGDPLTVRIVLQPTGAVSGRVLFERGAPAQGITAELAGTGSLAALHLFQLSDQNGLFTFPAVPIGTFTLNIQDPVGPGLAERNVQVVGVVALGDIALDETPPSIASTIPAASATGVPLNSGIRIVFSERVNAATITQSNVVLSAPTGAVLGTLQLTDVDTAILFTPLSPLTEQTRYTISVRNVGDLVGKVMAPFSASLVTIDLTPPSIVDLTPSVNGRGIALATTVRVRFSEPVDPTRYRGPPITLLRGGGVVDGRTDFILGNTAVVFTPTLPLEVNTLYQAQVAAASDLSGNVQPQALNVEFRTFDQTPPQVTGLTAGGNGSVIENATTQVVAAVDALHDISVVDFYVNDQPALAARTAPFTLTLQAIASVGRPGDQIRIAAFATDTSGNRSPSSAVLLVPVVADVPPAVSVTTPAGGAAFPTGDRVTVTVRTTDDLGVSHVGYRAVTGNPQDAATVGLAPTSMDVTRTFAFTVPRDAVPGSSIVINASATDTKGQSTPAAPVAITVLDATLPAVTITGTTTGARVAPGQQTTAIVLAEDLGGVASISLTTGGVAVGTEARPISPAQNSMAASFVFTVPNTARPGDTLTLDATAIDAAGNVGTAARIILPIADLSPPTLQLRTATGTLDLVPGTTATAIVEAADDTAVASAALQGQGPFSFSTARQVSPPSNSAQLSFAIPVPADAPEGATLNLSARATDVFGNVSAPVTLTLTVRSSQSVTLPPSAIVAAGALVSVPVQLGTPAGPDGVRVDLQTDDPSIARVGQSVQFNDGESSRSVAVNGLRGGVATLTALVNGVPRASMTITVRGGMVTGVVVDDQLQPVAGASVAVSSAGGFGILNAVTDGTGAFSVEGVGGGYYTSVTVKAFDPATQFIGFASGSLNVPNGFAHVTVVLVSAGSIGGSVVLTDGATPASAGARVDLFSGSQPSISLGTVFIDDTGAYEFPIVSLGSYFVEASDIHGNRGRSAAATLSATGQHVDMDVAYLGRGSVTGIVRDGSGNAVPNIPVSLYSTNLFGYTPAVQINAQSDGTFRFDNLFVGSFTVQARDQFSNLAGTVSGSIQQDGQVATAEIVLAPWATVQGTVFRPDGVTPVPGARVDLSGAGAVLTTTTDADGHYTLPFVPLGSYVLVARESATRGLGRVSGTLSANGQTVTRDVVFFPQGTLVVTVRDAGGVAVPGADVTVVAALGADTLFGTTDAAGVLLVEDVLAGDGIRITARSGGLTGTITTTLQRDEVKAITVSLMPTASIAGTVYLPDGQSPGAPATITACGYGCVTVPVSSDGRYRLDGLPLWTWSVSAKDANDQKRAVRRDVVLASAGQVATVDLTMIGLGSVTGRVLNPNSSSASDVEVTVHSLDPDLGGFVQARTDAAGFYRADRIVVGGVSVSAGDATRGLLGETRGTLAHDGDTLGLDVLLRNNALTLPVTKADANFFTFDLQRDGSIGYGFHGVFGYDCCPITKGALYLDVIANGTPIRFAGSDIGTTEDFGRQVVVSENGLAGLNVTRKVLVSNAYFARYLELLTNPTTSPITVDVRLHSKVKASNLFTTSSGDDLLDVSDAANPDRWAMFNQPEYDPILTNAFPQAGFVFDGSGARARVSIASIDASTAGRAQFEYGWTNVTIQPGQTVGFMHFAVQQYSRAAAQASLDRLAQLPPEALESLSPTEIAAIQNFAVSADGTSQIAPLSPLGGAITGRLLETDATTPVVSPRVRLRSRDIFFGRIYQTNTDANGSFSFGPANVNVPIDGFTLEADHPLTRVTSPPVAASFTPGLTTANADIVFSNTGIVRGSVRRTSGQLVSGAGISVSSVPLNLFATFAASGTDGSFGATGIPAGEVRLVASVPHPQGAYSVSLTGSSTVTVTAGQIQTRDVIIEPTGTLTGTVRTALGAAAPNALVQANGCRPAGCFALQTRTDSAGAYRFVDVPLVTFTVRAFDPNSNFPSSGEVTVAQDQTSTLNLTFVGTGSIAVVARLADGVAAGSAYVEVVRPSGASSSYADANGRVTITSVLPGAFILRVHHPRNFSAAVGVTGTISSTGQTVTVTAVLPPVGTLVVQVASGGAAAASAPVYTDAVTPGSMQYAGSTDGTGQIRQLNVPGGRTIQVLAYDSTGQRGVNTSTSITAEGQVATVAVSVDATGTITGRVLRGNAPVPSASVNLTGVAASSNRATQAGPDGTYVFDGVPLGASRVSVRDSAGAGVTNVQLLHDGELVNADVTLTATPLPATLADANGFNYTVGGGGYLSGGAYASFPSLNISSAGSFGDYFAGDSFASTELNGRQLVIPSVSSSGIPRLMAGLNVTRKVYVDPSGYFARILEVLENPGLTPALIDVGLIGSMRAAAAATSSGAASPGIADQWFVTSSGGTVPSNAAFVFASVDAPVPLAQLQASFGSVSAVWNSVIVPAGGRSVLMHFEAQAADQTTAIAMAQRLAQLPPEALVGLTLEEIAALQNFVVPADGSSPLAPFGSISGRVVGGDGVTPAPNVRVLVTGNAEPYFRSTVTVPTDADGRYLARTLAPGPVTVQATDPGTGALTAVVSATSDGQTPITRDLLFTTTGMLTGTVLRANGLPVPGVPVSIYNQSYTVFQSTYSGADGGYRFATLSEGTYTAQARLNDGRTASASGIGVSVGGVTTADLRLTAAAGVRVTVTLGGAPLAGARVYRDGNHAGNTSSAGTLLLPSVRAGPFTLLIYAPNSSSSSLTLNGMVLPEDDGNIIDVSAQVFLGSLSGTVFAADGATPIPYTNVEVFDEASGTRIQAASVDVAGHYEVANLLVTGPFRLVAHGPSALYSVTAQAVRSFDVSTTVVVNFQLPLGTVTGTVTMADRTTAVPNAYVAFAQQDVDGNTLKQTAGVDANGRFSFFGRSGIFDLEARDNLNWYAARASGSVDDLTTAQTVELALPPLGIVRGIVRDGNGQPVAGATVTIQATRTELGTGTGVSADSSGAFVFARVPTGGFALQACTYTAGAWVCGAGSGVVPDAGQTATVDITLPWTGTVSGTAFDSDGTTPLPYARVSITPVLDGHSFNSNLRHDVSADGVGQYTVDNVQAGPVTVTLTDYYAPGLATGIVAAGASTTVDVTRGSAARCSVALYDAAGFLTNATCSGALSVGGTYDGHLSDAYSTAYSLRINGQAPSDALAARTELDGRQIVYGPFGLGSVTATRKVFVPATGQFARYLDTVTNPTNTPVTIDVQVDSALNGAVHLVVDPATTGTYALTVADPSRHPNYGYMITRPALGHVFGALGAPVQTNAVAFQQLLGSSFYRWTVTIAPGQSMTFMHFAFAREPADIAGADAQAHALVDLSDPDALAGMTPAEKAAVVNFVIP